MARLSFAIAIPLLLASIGSSSVAVAADPAPNTLAANPKSVLFICQEDRALPAPATFLDALISALESSPVPTTMYTEDLNLSRFDGPGYQAALRAWYAIKYRNRQPDVIATSGLYASQFVLQHRDELWPGVPVVLTGVDAQFVSSLPLPSGVTALTIRVDVEGTLDFALTIFPETRSVAFIGRGPAYSDDTGTYLQNAAAKRGLEVVDVSDLPLDALTQRLSHLPEDTIVYFRAMIVDTAGRVFRPARLVEELSRAANRPIFSDVDTYLGHGIVGGSLASPVTHGEEAGKIVARILAGEPVSTIPVASSRAVYKAADWQELGRWGIKVARLPAGTAVRNRVLGFWEQYRMVTAGILLVIGLQAALITALLVERRQRRRAEHEARRRLQESAHLHRVSALGELSSSLAHELNQPLAAILTNAQAAQRLLNQASPDVDELRDTLKDIVDDDRRAGAVIQRMRTLLKKGNPTIEPLDLDALIRDAARLVRSSVRQRGAEIDLDLDGSLPAIAGDAVQLEQVILNLLVNGLDAMEETPPPGRRVLVRTACINGAGVELSVQDSGKGVPPEDLDHLFDPFFSTKPNGLGVGLAISRSIVQAHGGQIWAESGPHHGTTFRCVFPLLKEQEQ